MASATHVRGGLKQTLRKASGNYLKIFFPKKTHHGLPAVNNDCGTFIMMCHQLSTRKDGLMMIMTYYHFRYPRLYIVEWVGDVNNESERMWTDGCLKMSYLRFYSVPYNGSGPVICGIRSSVLWRSAWRINVLLVLLLLLLFLLLVCEQTDVQPSVW